MNDRVPQHNFECEQALLGTILMRQGMIEHVQGFLRPEHFADPAHGKIYAAAIDLHNLQKSVTPVTMKTYLAHDEDLEALGGDTYLMNLAASAASLVNAEDYGRMILDLALTRDLIGLGEDIVNEAFCNPNATEQIARHIRALERLSAQCNMDGIRTVSDIRPEIIDFYEGKRNKAFSSGWKCLDPHYMIVPGEMTVITGISNSGKSTWLDHLMVKAAAYYDWRFALTSLENPNNIHAAKLASIYLSMPLFGLNRMSKEQLDRGLDWVDKHFVFVKVTDDAPTIDWALSRIEAEHRERPLNGFVLDPYNEFEHQLEKGVREDMYISQMLSKVKRLGSRMQAHQWFVAHPRTAQAGTEDEAPSLSQISGGGNWANKADYGISVHRKWDELAGKRSNTTEVHVKKVRFGWQTEPGIAILDYDPQTVSYVGQEVRDRMSYPDD